MISGKGFSELATWTYDDRYEYRRFSPLLSKTGDTVFIIGVRIEEFAFRFLQNNRKKFRYIIHNMDVPFEETRLRMLLPSAIHIYSINTTVHHPQLTTIPIGFPDSGLKHIANIKPSADRNIEIYSNFSAGTNVVARSDCLKAFEGDPRVLRKDPAGRTQPEYYEDMCHSKFVLCPAGTGVDTHRIYEALYCGAIPVVLHSNLDHLYKKLPICILNSWTDPFYIPEGTARFGVRDFL